MKQVNNYGDERQQAWCVYCHGNVKGTRDHVPSKVLLDKPYPQNLPTVASCRSCNSSFSLDEEYVACLIECVLVGSTDPAQVKRENVSRILLKRPSLRARLAAAKSISESGTSFRAEIRRVQNVVLKLARGHVAFELNEPQFGRPDAITAIPLLSLNPEARTEFEEIPPSYSAWPEVGSRAMQRLVEGHDLDAQGWVVVQEGRYRFLSSAGVGVVVRVVLSEYLACEVVWPRL